jgi:hypothetical protein
MAPDLAQLRQFLSWCTVPVYFAVAIAFFRRGMWRSYRYFCWCLVAEGLILALLLAAQGNDRAYLQIYKVSQVPLWVLYVLMVTDLYRKVFARFPGIARFAQRVVVASICVAFALALGSIGGDISQGWSGRSMILRYSIILRAISAAISLFLILIAFFLVWLPIPLPVNTIRHSVLFFFYFFVNTFVHYVLDLGRGSYVQIANLVTSLSTLIALLCWYFLLYPAGESGPPSRKAPRTSSTAMLDRLEALNRTLSPPKE